MPDLVGEDLIVGESFVVGESAESIESEYKKSEKEILGTVANVRYYHQAAAWDSPLSFGVQAFIEYNGLTINNRYQSDLIRVSSITGLDDAEIRDSREPRPGESGEFAYDAFYGGRNLVITGFLEAGSLPALETLRRNLKAAYAPLVESPMKFRWFDVYDPFDDSSTILEYRPNAVVGGESGNYLAIIGSLENLKVENGFLSWSSPSKIAVIRVAEKRTFCDLQMTMRCIVGNKDSSYIGFVLCAKNSENYIATVYEENGGSPKLKIFSVIEGEEHTLLSQEITSAYSPVIGQSFWLRGRKEGNLVITEFWNMEPSQDFLPTFYIETYLKGEDEENYGDGILSEVGIIGEQANTDWNFDGFKIESIYPGDVKFDARKISPLSIKDEQTSLTKFKRPFQITMKSSDFRAFSSVQITRIIEPTSSISAPALGRSYSRKYPLSYRFFTSTTFPEDANLISINNRGTTYVEPILYLYGPGENILMENLTNEQHIEWLGAISEGDYMVFDCKEKTIVNSLGTDYVEPLVPSVEWIRLEPMWNDIYVTGSGFVKGKTKFVVKYRYGYM